MSHSAMIPFAALHFERDDFRPALVLDHIGNDGGILNQRGANGDFALVADEEDAVQRKLLACFGFQTIYNESIPRGNAVFLASRFDNCVHKTLEKKGPNRTT